MIISYNFDKISSFASFKFDYLVTSSPSPSKYVHSVTPYQPRYTKYMNYASKTIDPTFHSISPEPRNGLTVEFVSKYDLKITPEDDKLKEVILRSLAKGQK